MVVAMKSIKISRNDLNTDAKTFEVGEIVEIAGFGSEATIISIDYRNETAIVEIVPSQGGGRMKLSFDDMTDI